MDTPRCGTCLWFQRDGERPHGLCLVKPPILQVIMPPPSPVTGKVQPAIQGLRPPTAENDRCHKHRTLEDWLHPWQEWWHGESRSRADHVGAGTDRSPDGLVVDGRPR